jgi:hypothetical protein
MDLGSDMLSLFIQPSFYLHTSILKYDKKNIFEVKEQIRQLPLRTGIHGYWFRCAGEPGKTC